MGIVDISFIGVFVILRFTSCIVCVVIIGRINNMSSTNAAIVYALSSGQVNDNPIDYNSTWVKALDRLY